MDVKSIDQYHVRWAWRRCFSCMFHKNIFNNNNGRLYLKFKAYNYQDFFDNCSFGIEGDLPGPDEYERKHNTNNNRSPYDPDLNLEPDTVSFSKEEGDEFIARMKFPKCNGFMYRFAKKRAGKHTQLILRWFKKAWTLTEEERIKEIDRIMNVLEWSQMYYDAGKWHPLTPSRRKEQAYKIRNKIKMFGWINYIVKELECNPLKVGPRTPLVDICWPFLSNTLRDFYKRWLRIGEKQILQEAADNLVELSNPEMTSDYIKTKNWKGKKFVENQWLNIEESDNQDISHLDFDFDYGKLDINDLNFLDNK